jgi:hypothetical protein
MGGKIMPVRGGNNCREPARDALARRRHASGFRTIITRFQWLGGSAPIGTQLAKGLLSDLLGSRR